MICFRFEPVTARAQARQNRGTLIHIDPLVIQSDQPVAVSQSLALVEKKDCEADLHRGAGRQRTAQLRSVRGSAIYFYIG